MKSYNVRLELIVNGKVERDLMTASLVKQVTTQKSLVHKVATSVAPQLLPFAVLRNAVVLARTESIRSTLVIVSAGRATNPRMTRMTETLTKIVKLLYRLYVMQIKL